MPTSRYFDIHKDESGLDVMDVTTSGIALLRLALVNKGTAFTYEERHALGLDGLLPPQVNTLEQQLERAYRGYAAEPTPLAKYQYLRALQERQEILFYALLERHLDEMLPIVYTPTVGEAVRQFSAMYQNPRGLSLSPLNIGRADEILADYPLDDVRQIVATDSSAILGIGDQGYGGLAIPIGKLALYTAGGGVSPFFTMPVSLDVGTDRQDLIDDPFYLGVRMRRLRGDAYLEFMDRFVAAVKKRWPRAIIQWEDLAKHAAFTVLDRFRETQPSFNDDIQGTGAVALAGLLRACALRGERLRDQRAVVHGAGAGGVGVADAIRRGMIDDGLSDAEARARLFVLDSRGLLVDDRDLEDYKKPFAQPRARMAQWGSKTPGLLETIEKARATALFGLSGTPRCFDEPIIRAMAAQSARPIIFPMSNPTASCEADPADIMRLTDGKALVATGSPFPPAIVHGVAHRIGQSNNAFVFPGLGLGAIVAGARMVTDGMVMAGAYAVAEYTAKHHDDALYPPVDELPIVSRKVAAAVLARAHKDGVATQPAPDDVHHAVEAAVWHPRYLPVRRA
jgi:malate dehydrogenase (oxaloacetate-decarboxylating)